MPRSYHVIHRKKVSMLLTVVWVHIIIVEVKTKSPCQIQLMSNGNYAGNLGTYYFRARWVERFSFTTCRVWFYYGGNVLSVMSCLKWKQSYNFVHRLPVANRYMHLSCLHCTKKLFLQTTIEPSVSLGIRPKFNKILDCTPPPPFLPC